MPRHACGVAAARLTVRACVQHLHEGLRSVRWPSTVVDLQRSWIGRSQGAAIAFPRADGVGTLTVFTTRPETLLGVSFLAVGADSDLLNSVPGADGIDTVVCTGHHLARFGKGMPCSSCQFTWGMILLSCLPRPHLPLPCARGCASAD